MEGSGWWFVPKHSTFFLLKQWLSFLLCYFAGLDNVQGNYTTLITSSQQIRTIWRKDMNEIGTKATLLVAFWCHWWGQTHRVHRGTLEPPAQAVRWVPPVCFTGMEGEVRFSQPAWRAEQGWGSPASHIWRGILSQVSLRFFFPPFITLWFTPWC